MRRRRGEGEKRFLWAVCTHTYTPHMCAGEREGEEGGWKRDFKRLMYLVLAPALGEGVVPVEGEVVIDQHLFRGHDTTR
jgi:hypothetical protein